MPFHFLLRLIFFRKLESVSLVEQFCLLVHRLCAPYWVCPECLIFDFGQSFNYWIDLTQVLQILLQCYLLLLEDVLVFLSRVGEPNFVLVLPPQSVHLDLHSFHFLVRIKKVFLAIFELVLEKLIIMLDACELLLSILALVNLFDQFAR